MPLFNRPRDIALFNHFTRELVDSIIDTTITLFKVRIEETEANIYGESDTKTFFTGVCVPSLIDNQEPNYETEEFGQTLMQNVSFALHRPTLEEKGIYPEAGDYIEYNNAYFEIGEVIENQLIGGQTDTIRNYSIVVQTMMVSRDSINVEDVRPGIDRNNVG